MNIFALSANPIEAAKLQCDKHVVKMILETAQMLSTAHRELGSKISEELLYKKTHVNHPSAVWLRKSWPNYRWAVAHFEALCDEYTFRYKKVHLSDTKFREAFRRHAPTNLPVDAGFCVPPQCMPDDYKVECESSRDWGATIEAYRQYYAAEKSSIARYTKRPTPSFINLECD